MAENNEMEKLPKEWKKRYILGENENINTPNFNRVSEEK